MTVTPKSVQPACNSRGFKKDEWAYVRRVELIRVGGTRFEPPNENGTCALVFTLNNCAETVLVFPDEGADKMRPPISMPGELMRLPGALKSKAVVDWFELEDAKKDRHLFWDFTDPDLDGRRDSLLKHWPKHSVQAYARRAYKELDLNYASAPIITRALQARSLCSGA